MKDHYKILGIPFEASAAEIRKAYYALAQKYHPDKNAGSKIFEEKFKEINDSYEVLSNPNEKHHYDDLYRYIILKQNQNPSQQYYQQYQQQHQTQQKRYAQPTREHETDYSAFFRFIPFLLFGLFHYCNDSNKSNEFKIEKGDVRIMYQDSNGQVINGTLDQYNTDKINNNAFNVDYSDKNNKDSIDHSILKDTSIKF